MSLSLNPNRFRSAIDRKLQEKKIKPSNKEAALKALEGCVMGEAMKKAFLVIYK